MENTLFPSGYIIKSPLIDTAFLKPYSEGWDMVFRSMQKGKPLYAALKALHTPHIQISQAAYSSAYLVQGIAPKNSVVISYIVTDGVINYRNRRYSKGELIVLTHREEIDLVLSQGNDIYAIAIEEKFFYDSFFAYYGRSFEEVVQSKHRPLELADADAYLAFLHHWIAYFIEEGSAAALGVDYEKIEQEIIQTLFSFIVIDEKRVQRENSVLKSARELLHGNLQMDFKLTDTVAHLGVSQRTLEYTFRDQLGMTPKAYMQMLRLNAVRQELLVCDPKLTKVSDIALKYAFFHMGHFASEYRKLFGELPIETLQGTSNKNR